MQKRNELADQRPAETTIAVHLWPFVFESGQLTAFGGLLHSGRVAAVRAGGLGLDWRIQAEALIEHRKDRFGRTEAKNVLVPTKAVLATWTISRHFGQLAQVGQVAAAKRRVEQLHPFPRIYPAATP